MDSDDGTRTSDFGVSRRENHDSSEFYDQAIYESLRGEAEQVDYEENEVPDDLLDTVRCADSRDLSFLPENSVHLMVTSPPYVAAKEYDQEWSLDQYLGVLTEVFSEVYRTLVPGGRACVNIANIGRSPYIPLHAFVIEGLLELGFLMRGEVIWNKNVTAGTSTAWGSWQSASNPTLRDVHEYILVFSKKTFSRPKDGREDSISKENFLENTKSIWEFRTASAEEVGHPAPFPVELPRRLIELLSFEGDVVLDPFAGSGATCLAARSIGRHFVGIDKNQEYVELARKRMGDVNRKE